MSALPRRLVRFAADRALPPGSRARDAARVGVETYRQGRASWERYRLRSSRPVGYQEWLSLHRPGSAEVEAMHRAIETTTNQRRIVVVACGDDDVAVLSGSMAVQNWPHRHLDVQPSGVGPQHWNALADDDVVLLLRGGDALEPHSLFRLADAWWEEPHLDLVTFDDDAPATGGPDPRPMSLRAPRFHPHWSPDVLLSANYLGRSFAVRASVLKRVGFGGGESDLDWWELLLAGGFETDRVRHLPEVLLRLGERPPATPPGAVELVGRHLHRLALGAAVEEHRGVPRVRWTPEAPPKVSIIVPTRHNRQLLDVLVPSLERTDYPSWELVVVDNGGELEGHAEWYEQRLSGLDASVIWWHEPFNYSAVNNAAARQADGSVLVFLNDDTRVRSADWLWELAGWATHDPIGTVGVQLMAADGTIQHGGVVIGMNGFADHLFAGLSPGADTLIGSTRWYRDGLANTAACVAIRRELFEEIGGFDERFELLGSDVALGLECHRRGYRNLTTPMVDIDHLESTTRGALVPSHDMFTSYWWYQRWLRVGDPYYSPSLSLSDPEIRLRPPGEPTPLERVSVPLGRSFGVFRQTATEDEASMLADMCRLHEDDVSRIARLHEVHAGYLPVRSVNWFLPDIENPFYGGIATALRIAETLRSSHGVENRFICWAGPNEAWVRSALAAIFPGLADSSIFFHDGGSETSFEGIPDCDVGIATQWPTAYTLARYQGAKRYAYLIQDFEPMFHPAGTMYALAEETYRIGLYGLCNTRSMARFYTEDYEGIALPFVPAVDTDVFHADGRPARREGDPVRVFLYARPGHWRNCWEMVSVALDELKARHGNGLEIVTAGSWARPEDLGRGITHLGLLDYAATGDLYRSVDIGISLTVSPHPSYLPLELMACGAAVVAFQLEPGGWILDQGQTAVLVRRTVTGLVEGVSELIDDPERRSTIAAGGTARIARAHSSWSDALARVHASLSEPAAFAFGARPTSPRLRTDAGVDRRSGARSASSSARGGC
jgi:GT2 family glycosyltransferase/glycosyltransferase involved in cell wall biosynthesis